MGIDTTTYTERISKRLKELREEYKRNKTETAIFLGIERKQYSDYEDGKQSPGIFTLEKIADKYNVSIDYLLDRNECRSVDNDYICQQTGLSDNAIERLKSWNYNHNGYKPLEEYTRPLNTVLESIQAKNIMKAVLQYLDADTARIKSVTVYDTNEDRPIKIDDLDPARTTFDYEYQDGSTITGTVFNPSLLRTDALNQVKECLDIIRRESEKE